MKHFRARTLIDELRENWPKLDALKMNLIGLVYQYPDISMTEAADSLMLTIHELHYHAHVLADGTRGRNGFGFLFVGVGSDDKRERPMKLTRLGLKVAKLLAPLNIPVDDELTIKKDENQLDLLAG